MKWIKLILIVAAFFIAFAAVLQGLGAAGNWIAGGLAAFYGMLYYLNMDE